MYLALIAFSSVAACMSAFMVLYILTISKGLNLKKIALVAFLIALTIRVLKSVFYFMIFPNLSNWFLALGFLGFALMPPFLFFYFKLEGEDNITSVSKIEGLHFLFPLVGFISLLVSVTHVEAFYFLCIVSLGSYMTYVYLNVFRYKQKSNQKTETWDRLFFVALIVLFLAFLIPYVINFPESYALGTAIASLTIFFLFFFFLKYPPNLVKRKKTYRVDDTKKQLVINALEHEELYKDASITLHTFSKKIGVPQYIITEVVKHTYGKSFHGTINALRVKSIQTVLKENMSMDLKIEELAFDTGFNTASVFYAVFKKETSMSPREYQKACHSN